jgi:hypothetical protein
LANAAIGTGNESNGFLNIHNNLLD